MRITQAQINNLVKEIAELAGYTNNRDAAKAIGQTKYLQTDYAPIYGGYRLVMVGVDSGAHYGAFNGSGTEARLTPSVFYEKLKGLKTGLEYGIKAGKAMNETYED